MLVLGCARLSFAQTHLWPSLLLVAVAAFFAAAPQAAMAQAAGAASNPGNIDPGVRQAQLSAHEASEAARQAASAAHAAAEAAQQTALAVHALAEHVEELERTEPKAKETQLAPWSFTLKLGAGASTGNSSTFTGRLDTGVDGNFGSYSTEFRAGGAYGQNRPLATGALEITNYNGRISARGEHNYTSFLGNYLLFGALTDRKASIAYQTTGEVGISLIWWEVERAGYVKSRLRTSVGARALHEQRRQYYPTPLALNARQIYGPNVSLDFRYALSKLVWVTEEADVLYDVTNVGDTRANSTTTLSARLSDRLSLDISARIRYIGSPAAGKVSTDTDFGTDVTYAF